jgi:hypothetical protein
VVHPFQYFLSIFILLTVIRQRGRTHFDNSLKVKKELHGFCNLHWKQRTTGKHLTLALKNDDAAVEILRIFFGDCNKTSLRQKGINVEFFSLFIYSFIFINLYFYYIDWV